jgi:5-methylcytosine-specific restriction protein A
MARPSWTKRTEHRKLTGRPWRRLREQVMVRDKWLCQVCMAAGRYTEATEVDHIKALANDGDDKPENLRAICGPCHFTKTLRDCGIQEKVAVGNDGWPVEA